MCFDATGKRFVSASADATARIYNTMTGQCLHTLSGHEGEISKVSFNPQVSQSPPPRSVRVPTRL